MARTEVLPGELRFDCAGPVFYAIRDVVGLAEWMTTIAIIIIINNIIINNNNNNCWSHSILSILLQGA